LLENLMFNDDADFCLFMHFQANAVEESFAVTRYLSQPLCRTSSLNGFVSHDTSYITFCSYTIL